ncbi:MAG: ribosome biogenesis factor YjgA [Rhodocyclaceae bacterium]
MHHNDAQDHDEYDGPSKSQRKRDMDALQDLGAELVALPVDRFKKMDVPEALRDAILEMHRITKHEARRRQMQYIGKIMRGVDPAPLRAVLDEIKGVSAAATAHLHRLERQRERLLEDESVLTEIGDAYPDADLQRLRQLRRNAIKEREQNKPPRAFREIFQILRALEDVSAEPAGDDDDDDDNA